MSTLFKTPFLDTKESNAALRNLVRNQITSLFGRTVSDGGERLTPELAKAVVDGAIEAVIRRALTDCKGSQLAASKQIGISRNSLTSCIKRYNIKVGGSW